MGVGFDGIDRVERRVAELLRIGFTAVVGWFSGGFGVLIEIFGAQVIAVAQQRIDGVIEVHALGMGVFRTQSVAIIG